MDDKFLMGVILGMVGGAVIVTNSAKARQAVKSSQQQVIDKIEDMGKQNKKNSSACLCCMQSGFHNSKNPGLV